MPRRRSPEKRKVLPDPKYKDVILAKFMNNLMKDGKKSVAEKIVYGAFDQITKTSKEEPLDVFMKVSDKAAVLHQYMIQHQIQHENILYMGDDIPDVPVMKLVGLPCCPQDAAPEVKAISEYISHVNGGCGAARDIIEQVMKVRGLWMRDFDAQND